MRAPSAFLLFALALSPSCAETPSGRAPSFAPSPAVVTVVAATPSPGAAPGRWTIRESSPPEVLGPGMSYLRQSLLKSDPDDPARSTLHLVRFDSSAYRFKVIDQGDTNPGHYSNLAEALLQNACIAGCNGGYFHPDFRPLGLVIADGDRINRFENSRLLSGLLLVDAKGPRLLRRAEFEDHSGITQLLQSGPFLVDRGKTVNGLSSSPARTRVFVATDAKGDWAIGLCTRISLADLGEVLADPALLEGFRINRALNLDGGSSSSLYFARPKGGSPYHSRGFASVRNFLGVVPK